MIKMWFTCENAPLLMTLQKKVPADEDSLRRGYFHTHVVVIFALLGVCTYKNHDLKLLRLKAVGKAENNVFFGSASF